MVLTSKNNPTPQEIEMADMHTILAIGETITYERVAPFTFEKSIVTTKIEGRNWHFDVFRSYIVRGGECVYLHQLR